MNSAGSEKQSSHLSMEDLVARKSQNPLVRVSNPVGLGSGWRNYASNKFPGAVAAGGPGSTFWEPVVSSKDFWTETCESLKIEGKMLYLSKQ